jgi:hypothetical protein
VAFLVNNRNVLVRIETQLPERKTHRGIVQAPNAPTPTFFYQLWASTPADTISL